MIPVIADRGSSFAGAFAYYCHDKNAWTAERVAWSQCLNLMTDCLEKAWKRMAYTAMHQTQLKQASGQRMTGAKLQKPVFCYSLSWHPEQNPSQQSMMQAVTKTLQILGLAEHQAIIAAHQDEPHPHVHVMVNAVHPITGLVAKLKNTKRKLSKFALNHEREEGKVYCPQREANHRKREAGMNAKHCDPVLLKAWEQSSDALGFMAALSQNGYQLAKGRRIVVVDPHGNVINPVRSLGLKSKEFMEGLNGLDEMSLSSLDGVLKSQTSEPVIDDDDTVKTGGGRPSVNPALEAIQSEISGLKTKLRQSGVLSRWFGLSAYRKRKLVRLRQQFNNAPALDSHTQQGSCVLDS